MCELIVPSYGRPDRLRVMIDSANETAATPPNIRPIIEQYDPLREIYQHRWIVYVGDFGTSSAAWLAGFAALRNINFHIAHMAADDLVYITPKWDERIFAAMPPGKAWVVQHKDNLRDDKQFCTPFMSREFLELCDFQPWSPELKHFYTDTWIEDVARRANCWTYCDDVLIEQRHWKNKLAPNDATYARPRDGKIWPHDDAIFASTTHMREELAKKIIQFNGGVRGN